MSLSMAAQQGCERRLAGTRTHSLNESCFVPSAQLFIVRMKVYVHIHVSVHTSPRISERPLKWRLLLSALEVKCFQSALREKRQL